MVSRLFKIYVYWHTVIWKKWESEGVTLFEFTTNVNHEPINRCKYISYINIHSLLWRFLLSLNGIDSFIRFEFETLVEYEGHMDGFKRSTSKTHSGSTVFFCLLFCISSRTAVEKRIVVTQNIILDSICIYCVAIMKRVPSKNRFIVASAK